MSTYTHKPKRNHSRCYWMMKAEKLPYFEFQKLFSDDDACLEYIWNARYAHIQNCPQCDREFKYYRIKKRKQYACSHCGHHVAPLVGTPFENTKLALSMWFYALYLWSITKNGISAKELERILGVHYETAWSMLKKIRGLVAQENYHIYFTDGTTEIDDSYFGGKLTNKHAKEIAEIKQSRGDTGLTGRSAVNKTVAIGAVNRESGQAQVEVLPGKAPNLVETDSFIADTLDKNTNTVITDDFSSYKKLSERGVDHSTVEHGTGQYAHGIVHINSVENLWSTIKRSLDGTYRGVSKKYLQMYLDEFVFRYNHRGQKVLHSVLRLLHVGGN